VIAEKPWKFEAVVRLVLGFMATACSAGLVAAVLESKSLGLNARQLEFAQVALAAVFFHGAMLVWAAIFLREVPLSWREAFGLGADRQRQAVAWGTVAALVFMPVGLALEYLSGLVLPHPEAQHLVQVLGDADLPVGELAFIGVVSVFLAPLAEEVLFRGIVYPTIKQLGYPRLALWLTSLVFGLAHFNLPTLVPLTCFSLVLIFLYEKTGSLWASITAHSVFNLTSFALVLLQAQPAATHAAK
jgi:membrane protease YdiL (CAAX protease family)